MNVVKNNETVFLLPREYSWILWYFIPRGGKIRVAVTGCRRLVVRVKQKLMAWKNFWRARFAGKHSKTPLGATTTEKRSMSYTKTLSVSFSAPLEELWILIRILRTPNTDVSIDKPHPRFVKKKCGLYMDVTVVTKSLIQHKFFFNQWLTYISINMVSMHSWGEKTLFHDGVLALQILLTKGVQSSKDC